MLAIKTERWTMVLSHSKRSPSEAAEDMGVSMLSPSYAIPIAIFKT